MREHERFVHEQERLVREHERVVIEQVDAQRRLRRELDQRLRGNLSTLMSLMELSCSSASSMDHLAAAMRSHTRAITAVNALLSTSAGAGVDLAALLGRLAQAPGRAWVRIDGPTIVIPASGAV